MSSGAALHGQIGSIITALCNAAAAQITKVVEEGLVVLRLEVTQREHEIRRLRSSVEVLHGELRAAHRTAARLQGAQQQQQQQQQQLQLQLQQQQPQHPRGGAEIERHENHQSHFPKGEVVIKREPTGQVDCGQPEPLPERQRENQTNVLADARHGALASRGLHRQLYSSMRRRMVNRLMFKRGFTCSFCGKCFENSGNLERHKRVHTGEKPYRCDVCGRRFNQKCSLKEHTKIHQRCVQSSPADIQRSPEEHPSIDTCPPVEGDTTSVAELVSVNCPESSCTPTVKSEPLEECVTQPEIETTEKQKSPSLHDMTNDQSERNGATVPATQVIPVLAEASCSNFTFPGKPYVENNLMSSLLAYPRSGGEPSACPQNRTGSLYPGARPKKCFFCSYCGKMFVRGGHLERHLRIHTGEKPYGCHICGRCFNQKSSLKCHMKTHRNDKNGEEQGPHPIMCPIPDTCMQEPATNPTLEPAALGDPLNVRPYVDAGESDDCLNAGEWQDYAANGELRFLEGKLDIQDPFSQVGMVAHDDRNILDFGLPPSDSTQNSYICSACGQSFDSFPLFERHQCKSEAVFKCEVCGQGFDHADKLQLHIKVHQ